MLGKILNALNEYRGDRAVDMKEKIFFCSFAEHMIQWGRTGLEGDET